MKIPELRGEAETPLRKQRPRKNTLEKLRGVSTLCLQHLFPRLVQCYAKKSPLGLQFLQWEKREPSVDIQLP